jgi:hypothetical protein
VFGWVQLGACMGSMGMVVVMEMLVFASEFFSSLFMEMD